MTNLVFTDYILFPYLIGLTVWLVKSIMTIKEQQIRLDEKLDRMLKKEEYYKDRITH